MKIHELKCWPKFFQDVWDGKKTFDIRKGDDRKYEVGDEVILREFFPADLLNRPTFGRSLRLRILYVVHGGLWLPPDTWVFSFKIVT